MITSNKEFDNFYWVIKLNIVIINLGYIGDVINISPVVKALKIAYPESTIIVITSPVSVITAKCIPGVDNAIAFSRYAEHKGANIFGFALEFRKKYKTDLAIILNENFRSALLSFLMGASKRIGRDCDGRGFLLTHKISFTEDERQQKVQVAKHYLRVLSPLNIDCSDKKPDFNVLNEAKQKIKNMLKEQNSENFKLIGLCPATGTNGNVSISKCWNVEEATQFIKYINSKGGYKVVIVGQDACADFAENIRKKGLTNFIDLTNKTPINELAATLTFFEKFISVDSAPMHLAVAVNTPVISLFFDPNYQKWAPENNLKNTFLFNKSNISSDDVIKAFENSEGIFDDRRD